MRLRVLRIVAKKPRLSFALGKIVADMTR